MQTESKNGVAIIIVMCFILVLTVLATVASRSVGTQANVAKEQINIEKSFYIAEAGAERGAAHVANGGAIPFAFKGQLGNGNYYYVTITSKATVGEGSGNAVNGVININPAGGSHNSFQLTIPGGSTITKSSLNQNYGGYVGPAIAVQVKPDSSGSQNGLTVNGQAYPINNSTTYSISSSHMNVALFNNNIDRQGKAVGNWYISIGATDASISP